MESTQDLKARIIRIANSTFPITAHNKAIINAACKELYSRTGEVYAAGKFIAA